MSDGNLFKPDKDFTKDVDDLLPKAKEQAKVCFQAALLSLWHTNVSCYYRPTSTQPSTSSTRSKSKRDRYIMQRNTAQLDTSHAN